MSTDRTPHGIDLTLNREERTHDHSGTPVGLIVQAQRLRQLAYLGELTPEQEVNVLTEYTVGSVWATKTGFRRFVRFRKPEDGMRYAVVESGDVPKSTTPQAPKCEECGYRAATENGRCGICQAPRSAQDETQREDAKKAREAEEAENSVPEST